MGDSYHRLNPQQQEARNDRAEQLVAQGLLQEVIAARLGMTRGGLASMLQRRRRKRERNQARTPG